MWMSKRNQKREVNVVHRAGIITALGMSSEVAAIYLHLGLYV